MIDLRDCMAMGCADSLLKRHREHVKNENKKDKQLKHVCTEECWEMERVAHQETHDWYTSQKKV
jgi:hypothetical protein